MTEASAPAPTSHSERQAILDGLATTLGRRDEAADRRERALTDREAELRTAQRRAAAAERELDELRAGLYAERAECKAREERLKVREADADARARVVQELVTASKTTASELAAKRQQCAAAAEKLAGMYAALRSAQDSLVALRQREERAERRERECADVVAALDARHAELDALQTQLHGLQQTVARREAAVSDTAALLPALRQAHRQWLVARGDGASLLPATAAGADEGRGLASFVDHIAALAKREQDVERREERAAAAEQLMANARASEERLNERLRQVERREAAVADAKSMLERSEENLARLVEAERKLEERERSVRDAEQRAADAAAHAARQRKLLAAQEKSIRRAGDAVRQLEDGVTRDKLQTEQHAQRLRALEEDVVAREALLNTRQMELDAREASHKRTTNTNANANASANGGDLTRTRTRTQPTSQAAATRPTATDKPKSREDAAPSSEQREQSVRKQLTFGQTPGATGGGGAPHEDDSSSEAAADELHNELHAARAVWVEKVDRLDTVVAELSRDLTTTGTQLLPVIRDVRAELGAIRAEASAAAAAGDPESTGGGKLRREQARHLEWSRRVNAQLATIGQVQAGLLHAFKRVLPDATPTPQPAPAPAPAPLPREPLRERDTPTTAPSSELRVEQMLKEIDITPRRRRTRRRKQRSPLPLAVDKVTGASPSRQIQALRRELGLDVDA